MLFARLQQQVPGLNKLEYIFNKKKTIKVIEQYFYPLASSPPPPALPKSYKGNTAASDKMCIKSLFSILCHAVKRDAIIRELFSSVAAITPSPLA